MEDRYLYETFSAESKNFESKFTDYLNRKSKDNWRVKSCSYCHDSNAMNTWASCLFER